MGMRRFLDTQQENEWEAQGPGALLRAAKETFALPATMLLPPSKSYRSKGSCGSAETIVNKKPARRVRFSCDPAIVVPPPTTPLTPADLKQLFYSEHEFARMQGEIQFTLRVYKQSMERNGGTPPSWLDDGETNCLRGLEDHLDAAAKRKRWISIHYHQSGVLTAQEDFVRMETTRYNDSFEPGWYVDELACVSRNRSKQSQAEAYNAGKQDAAYVGHREARSLRRKLMGWIE